MYVALLEQFSQDSGERLRRNTRSLARPRERDSALGSGSLIRQDSHSAISVERACLPINDRQLHPLPGLTGHKPPL